MVPTNSACRKCCEDDTNSVEAEEAGRNDFGYISERWGEEYKGDRGRRQWTKLERWGLHQMISYGRRSNKSDMLRNLLCHTTQCFVVEDAGFNKSESFDYITSRDSTAAADSSYCTYQFRKWCSRATSWSIFGEILHYVSGPGIPAANPSILPPRRSIFRIPAAPEPQHTDPSRCAPHAY